MYGAHVESMVKNKIDIRIGCQTIEEGNDSFFHFSASIESSDKSFWDCITSSHLCYFNALNPKSIHDLNLRSPSKLKSILFDS
jgi:hypothetical protein